MNRDRYNHSPAERWGRPEEFSLERPLNQGEENFYQRRQYHEDRNENDYPGHGDRSSRYSNAGFSEGRNFGRAQNYGAGPYGGSTLSGGGGGFGSPSDYGAGDSGNYSGGYYGTSGSYGSGSSYPSGGNYQARPGSQYPNQPMQGYDNPEQGDYHGRTGFRSNYTSINREFDAVMEDPMTGTNYEYGNYQPGNDYRDYNLDDNYGSTRGRYSDFNNYRGNVREGGRYGQEGRHQNHFGNEQDRNWFERAGEQVKHWFGRD